MNDTRGSILLWSSELKNSSIFQGKESVRQLQHVFHLKINTSLGRRALRRVQRERELYNDSRLFRPESLNKCLWSETNCNQKDRPHLPLRGSESFEYVIQTQRFLKACLIKKKNPVWSKTVIMRMSETVVDRSLTFKCVIPFRLHALPQIFEPSGLNNFCLW